MRIFFIFLVIIILLFVGLFVFADRIAAYGINHFTDYRIYYDKCKKVPFSSTTLWGLTLEHPEKGITAKAEKVSVVLRGRRSISERTLIADCVIEGLRVGLKDKNALMDAGDPGSILDVPFWADQKFRQVRFTVYYNEFLFEIEQFDADSKDIKMSGEVVYKKPEDRVSLDMNISVSPTIAGTIPGDIREKILTPEKDGWWGTIISFKGPAVLLKAVYSLAT